MYKLTANTHGYEFELMDNVFIRYDACMIGELVHVDSFAMIISAPTPTAAHDATTELSKYYDDECSVKAAIAGHFVNQVF